MTFLPIVARELRVTARRPATYWSRMLVAGVMLLVASWVFVMSHRQPSSTQALALFGTLAGGMVLVGAVSGMGATADSLSSEKREGTLGLLFLTPLRGYDVVFGKLCAGSLSVLYGMVSVTPILALPLLMGGVSAMEFLRMALLMLNTMLFSLSIGIWISSISRDEKRARAAALGIVILFAGGFPFVGAMLEEEYGLHGVGQWFMLFSPGYAFARAWDRATPLPWLGYWPSMLTLHGLTWLFLASACWFTPRTWQERAVKQRGGLRRVLRSARAPETRAEVFRRGMLNRNAYLWLTSRPWYRPVPVWGVLVALTAAWLVAGIKYPNEMFDSAFFVLVALVWNLTLKLWLTSEATRQIAQDRKSGAIELLLSTAVTVRDIIAGQWLALRRQFGMALGAVLLGELLLMILGARDMGGGEDRIVWLAVWICGMTVLVADSLTLHIVGLWQSSVTKGPAEAAGGTAFRILALPWILFMLLGAAVAVADGLGLMRNVPDPEWGFWLLSWLFLSLGVNLWFGIRSWNFVQTEFREAASRRGGRGWGYTLGRWFGKKQRAH